MKSLLFDAKVTSQHTHPKVGLVVVLNDTEKRTVTSVSSEFITLDDGSYMTRSDWRDWNLPVLGAR